MVEQMEKIAKEYTKKADKEPEDKVGKLIKQLGKNSPSAEREKAEKELIKIGEPALDAVKKAVEDKDTERAKYAEAIWGWFEKRIVKDIEIKLKADKEEYESGEKIDITLTIEVINNKKDTIKIPESNKDKNVGNNHYPFDVKILDIDKVEEVKLSFQECECKPNLATLKASESISYSRSLRITLPPGNYKIKVIGRDGISCEGGKSDSIKGSSDIITIKVVEKKEEK